MTFNGFGAHLMEIRILTVFCQKCIDEDLCGNMVGAKKNKCFVVPCLDFCIGFMLICWDLGFTRWGQPLP